jgi:glycosyltransferase involved in cell wall biosynthesis
LHIEDSAAGGPLRVVQFVETLNTGGLEVLAVNLAIAQREAGHFASIYTLFEAGDLADRARDAGVYVVAFRMDRGFGPEPIFRIARQLRADAADVLHTHNSAIHHWGALAARLAGVKAIVNTRHGLALHSARRQDLYYRAVMPLTDAVVFVCEDGRRHYVERGTVPASKAHVIWNGIPLEEFQRERAKPGAMRQRLRFGTIGRMVKAKAHADLVEAFALIAGELPDAELHIWGDGPLRREVSERVAARGLESRVWLHGATASPAQALRTLDAFMLSSISEGLPLVVLEAMAAGLPVVSTRVGGVPEVAPEGSVAWYCESGDIRGLADAMRQAAAADLAAAGDRAFELAAERFGIASMEARYAELFRSSLSGGRSRTVGQ